MQTFIELSAVVHELSCPEPFALPRNGEKSENPVLWPWPLTYDFQNQ